MAGDLGASTLKQTIDNVVDLASARLDGFVSDFGAFGDKSLDRTKAYHFEAEEYSPGDMRERWREDPLVAAFIEKPARAMFKRGFEITTESRDLDDALHEIFDRIHVVKSLRKTVEYSRAFRGGATFLKFDDAIDDPARLCHRVAPGSKLLLTEPYDADELMVIGGYWDHDLLSPTFGHPLQWLWRPALARGGQAYVHPSRLLVISGPTPSNWDAISRAGWGVSPAHRVLQHVADYYNSIRALLCTLQSSDLFVVGVKGLVALRGRDDGSQKLKQLILGWAQGRSNAGILPIDADLEKAERMSSGLSGLKEAFEPIKETLAMAFDMPLAEIFSQEVTGLGANGTAAQDRYDDAISGAQKAQLEPHVIVLAKRVLANIAPGYTGHVEVHWNALRIATDDEQATTRLKVAQADQIYYSMGARPVDLLKSRFGGERYSAETHVDSAWLESMSRAAQGRMRSAGSAPAPTPAVPASTPATPASGATEVPLATTALNGAQVTSALQIVSAVATRQLPRDAAVSMLIAFFQLSAQAADRVLGEVGRSFFVDNATPVAPPTKPGGVLP